MTRRYWSRRQLVALVLVTSAVTAWLSPWRAYGADVAPRVAAGLVKVERADRAPRGRVAVSYVERVARGRYYVELNNGAAYLAPSCRHEDSRRCYWSAVDRGNRRGRSFLALNHRVYYAPAAVAARR